MNKLVNIERLKQAITGKHKYEKEAQNTDVRKDESKQTRMLERKQTIKHAKVKTTAAKTAKMNSLHKQTNTKKINNYNYLPLDGIPGGPPPPIIASVGGGGGGALSCKEKIPQTNIYIIILLYIFQYKYCIENDNNTLNTRSRIKARTRYLFSPFSIHPFIEVFIEVDLKEKLLILKTMEQPEGFSFR